jgi:hypothetical protein
VPASDILPKLSVALAVPKSISKSLAELLWRLVLPAVQPWAEHASGHLGLTGTYGCRWLGSFPIKSLHARPGCRYLGPAGLTGTSFGLLASSSGTPRDLRAL